MIPRSPVDVGAKKHPDICSDFFEVGVCVMGILHASRMTRMCGGLLCLVATLCVASGEGRSRPVGYLRVDLAPRERRLCSLPYAPVSGAYDDVFSGKVGGLTVLKWDSKAAIYLASYVASDGRWVSDLKSAILAPLTLAPGEGFWLINTLSVSQTVYMTGAVIGDDTIMMSLAPSLSLVGYPYSSAVYLTNNAIGQQVSNADSCDSIFDPTDELAVDGLMEPGRGYWYNHGRESVLTVGETRPYSSVGFVETNAPVIADISVSDAGLATVHVVSNPSVESINVYYKDLSLTVPMDFASGWTVAVANVPLNGATSFSWTDASSTSSAARVYSVGRANVDSELDGSPALRAKRVNSTPNQLAVRSDSPVETLTELHGKADSGVGESGGGAVAQTLAQPKTVYVDAAMGNDTNDGLSSELNGGHGPKRMVRTGLGGVVTGDTLVIRAGDYRGERAAFPGGVRVICDGRVVLD